jgi:hypothetical protein
LCRGKGATRGAWAQKRPQRKAPPLPWRHSRGQMQLVLHRTHPRGYGRGLLLSTPCVSISPLGLVRHGAAGKNSTSIGSSFGNARGRADAYYRLQVCTLLVLAGAGNRCGVVGGGVKNQRRMHSMQRMRGSEPDPLAWCCGCGAKRRVVGWAAGQLRRHGAASMAAGARRGARSWRRVPGVGAAG